MVAGSIARRNTLFLNKKRRSDVYETKNSNLLHWKQKNRMWGRWEKTNLYTQLPDILIDTISPLLAYYPDRVAYAHQKESAQAYL